LYSANYFAKKPETEAGSEEAVEQFYNILLEKLDPNNYRYLNSREIRKLSSKVYSAVNDLYNQSENLAAALFKTNSYVNFARALPLSTSQMSGLVTSYLINNSEKIRVIRFRDGEAMKLDYLGSFTPPGKSVIVYGSAGKHLGYKHDDGAVVFSTHKTPSNAGKVHLAIDSLEDSLKYCSRGFVGVLGSIYSSVMGISILQDEGVLPAIMMPMKTCLPGALKNYCTTNNVPMSLLGLLNEPLGVGGVQGPLTFLTGLSVFSAIALGVLAYTTIQGTLSRYKERKAALAVAAEDEDTMKQSWKNASTYYKNIASKRKVAEKQDPKN
jgi:hypothetical protein